MSVGKKIRKTGIWMLAALLFLGGCKKVSPAGEKETKEERAMGRYVEEQMLMEADPGECEAFACLADGRLALFSKFYGPLISEDEGRTWMPWQSEWFGNLQRDFWLKSAAICCGMRMAAITFICAQMQTERFIWHVTKAFMRTGRAAVQ